MQIKKSNIVMQRTEGTGTGYAKNGITCARSLSLVKKHSAAPDHGVGFCDNRFFQFVQVDSFIDCEVAFD